MLDKKIFRFDLNTRANNVAGLTIVCLLPVLIAAGFFDAGFFI